MSIYVQEMEKTYSLQERFKTYSVLIIIDLDESSPHGSELERPSSGKSYSDNEDRLDDREDNRNNCAICASSECGSFDDMLSKLTLLASSTEIGKESNEINGAEGSCEVQSVAGKCPVQDLKAVQLLSACSSNSDCLDVNWWMEGCHPSPLLFWFRNKLSGSIHVPKVGIILGNLKPKNFSMTDRSFRAQLLCIKKNKMDPFLVKYTREAKDLFSRLREKNPELSRLEAREVNLHPFFWRSNVKLRFLQLMSAKLHENNPACNPKLLTKLQSNEPPLFDGNWINKLDPIFETYILGRKEKYDFSSVKGLVRFMRNKSVHLNEFPDEIKKLVGRGEEGFYTYFDLQFPGLFMKIYGAAFQYCREEEWFKDFLVDNFPEYFG